MCRFFRLFGTVPGVFGGIVHEVSLGFVTLYGLYSIYQLHCHHYIQNLISPRMQADNFEIAQNEQKLQYFSYLRQVMQTKQINYWIGNPSVSIINGTIFLKPGIHVETCQQIDSHEDFVKEYRSQMEDRCLDDEKILRTLVLIGIPNCKNPIEVCDRLGAYLDWIEEIRVIKTNHFKFYGMLLLLKDEERSKKFCYEVFGQEYNSLEIERILIREMQEFSCIHTETSKADNDQLFQTRKKSNMGMENALQRVPADEIFMRSNSQNFSTNFANSPRKKQPHKQTMANKSQNATCTICFEQTEGTLISILCSHYFHVKCLSQWKENICPLCRYHQQPPLIKFCEKCNECEGLWVCLVCGVRLCCGFDHNILGNDSHIYQHYLETMHRLSMDVETKFIFDASQPAFLHQMLCKEVLKGDEGSDIESQSTKKGKKTKLSQKISEYEQSISEQMQKQRTYFQDSINKQIKKRKELIKQKRKLLSQAQAEVLELDKQLEQAEQKRQEYQQGSATFEKELKAIAEVQKYWKSLSDKIKIENNQKSESEKKLIRDLDQQIALKKEELKDFQRNKQLSMKIKSNVGKDQVEKTLILGNFANKDPKKKKK